MVTLTALSAVVRTSRRLLIGAALTAALTALLSLPGPAQARGERIEIDGPANDRVSGKIRYSARATRGAVRVSFYIDGRRWWLDRAPKWQFGRSGVLDTSRLAPGRHRLMVYARFRNRRLVGDSTTVSVVRASTRPPSDPAPKPPAPRSPAWAASFENGSFSEWTWWKRDDGCSSSVVDADSAGVPRLSGERVAHFKNTADCLDRGTPHSKLLKEWALSSPETGWHDDAGRGLERLPNDSPSGTYRASYFLPSGYTYAGRGWTNIMQFKATNPATGQLPQWWVNISPARDWGRGDKEPMLNVENWGNGTYGGAVRAAPRGRWFEIKAEVYNRDRIEFSLDGEPWQTVRHETHPIGTGPNTQGWIFGVGHYLGVGELWVDRTSYTGG